MRQPFGRLLPFKADVFEIAGIPQGVEVALKAGGVVDIAGVGENPRLHGIGRNAPVAVDHDFSDQILLRPSSRTKKDEKTEQKAGDGTAHRRRLSVHNPQQMSGMGNSR